MKLFELITVAGVSTFAGILNAVAFFVILCTGWADNDIALIAVIVLQVIAFRSDITAIYIRNIVKF